MIYNYILSLGSNIEPRLTYLTQACELLLSIGHIRHKSSIYETEAWGHKDQAHYYNALIEFEAPLRPQILLQELKNIENKIGRSPSFHWGPREIDIDIIFCQDCTINEPNLQIPHPEFAQRRFILEPMLEINENYVITNTNKKIVDFLNNCQDPSDIQKLTINW